MSLISENWYIVDTSGDTQGPMNEQALIKLYLNETIHSKTYIWNGLTVKQWTPIMNVKYVYDKIKHQYIHYHEPILNQSIINTKPVSTQNNINSFQNENKDIPKTISPVVQSTANHTDDEEGELITEEYIPPYEDVPKQNQDFDKLKTESNAINQQKQVPIDNMVILNDTSPKEEKHEDKHHKNAPKYPSSLQFLKRNTDRVDLMANIRNGIKLRDGKISAPTKQKKSTNPPKRIKDQFKSIPNDRSKTKQSVSLSRAEFVSDSHQNYAKQSYNPSVSESTFPSQSHRNNVVANDEDEDELSLSTEIDSDLLLDVKKNGCIKTNTNTVHQRISTVYMQEVAERASLIRKRFGDVSIVSGKGSKNEKNNLDSNVEPKQYNSLKSQEIANRIAKLKHKLDQLTINESWIITRIENVFLTARR
mmetsp:Transcript_4275/g.3739  ORF Transcript_4275/g.3739 Transcript_4275/m.3739 type:complete len:420 (-) Transcript_4275:239-1498(-)